MEFHRCILVSLTLFGLLPECSASLSSCPSPPPCGQGFGLQNCVCVRCLPGQYRASKSGLPRCERCTPLCSAGDRNLKEVISCGPNHNRVCHCDKGFFCESKAQYTCRRCQPCRAGTFSSQISNDGSCQPYTDCAGLGLTVISNGTSTQDQLCDSPIIDNSTDPLISNAKTIPFPDTTHEPQNTHGFFEESLASSSASLLVLVAVLLAAAVLLLCCMRRKQHLLKRKSWPFLKHVQGRKEDTMGGNFYAPSQGLLGSTMGNAQQVGTPKQPVAMEHSGGGDSVNNTVGSIYIYSPKMVVLGSNTAEQREEVKPPGEAWPHLDTPHQEHGPPEPPVTVCVQEEEGKDLRYPVPATTM